MVTPPETERDRGRPRPGAGENGSTLVVAVLLATVLALLGGGLVVRASAALAGAEGAEDRLRARLRAEQELEAAIRASGSGELLAAVRGRVIPITEAVSAGGDVTVRTGPGTTPDERNLEVQVRVGSAAHSARARVRPFLTADHLLLLEHRVIDPVLLGLGRSACTPPVGDPRRSPSCRDATVGPGTLDGPVHAEDGVAFDAATIVMSDVTSGLIVTRADGTVAASLGQDLDASPGPSRVGHRSGIALPRDIDAVRGSAPVTCRFRGPTVIRFDGATVRVRSPLSAPHPGDGGGDAVGCMGVDRDLLDDFTPIALPSDAVIEVVRAASSACAAHPLGLGVEDVDRPWACDAGTAFVWGRYRGRRTVLAEDHIQIVWDLEPGDATQAVARAGGDLLGLVAGDSVVLRRPVGRPIRGIAPLGTNVAFAGPDIPPFGGYPWDAPSATAVTWDRPQVVASLVALRGSVTVQNPLLGQPHAGPLVIEGSLAARFPGLFAWESRSSTGTLIGETGYDVVLRYDQRLTSDAPLLLPITDLARLRIVHRDVG